MHGDLSPQDSCHPSITHEPVWYWLMTLNIDPLFLERKLKMKKNVRISSGKSNSIGKYSYNVVEKGVYA